MSRATEKQKECEETARIKENHALPLKMGWMTSPALKYEPQGPNDNIVPSTGTEPGSPNVPNLKRERSESPKPANSRTTLEQLATIFETHEQALFEPTLREVKADRVGKPAHVGRSRKEKTTRADVIQLMARALQTSMAYFFCVWNLFLS